jgi:hypothetical protein
VLHLIANCSRNAQFNKIASCFLIWFIQIRKYRKPTISVSFIASTLVPSQYVGLFPENPVYRWLSPWLHLQRKYQLVEIRISLYASTFTHKFLRLVFVKQIHWSALITNGLNISSFISYFQLVNAVEILFIYKESKLSTFVKVKPSYQHSLLPRNIISLYITALLHLNVEKEGIVVRWKNRSQKSH